MQTKLCAAMFAACANDNAPDAHDPRDWEDFDPAAMPADAYYADDTPMDVCAFMALAG